MRARRFFSARQRLSTRRPGSTRANLNVVLEASSSLKLIVVPTFAAIRGSLVPSRKVFRLMRSELTLGGVLSVPLPPPPGGAALGRSTTAATIAMLPAVPCAKPTPTLPAVLVAASSPTPATCPRASRDSVCCAPSEPPTYWRATVFVAAAPPVVSIQASSPLPESARADTGKEAPVGVPESIRKPVDQLPDERVEL